MSTQVHIAEELDRNSAAEAQAVRDIFDRIKHIPAEDIEALVVMVHTKEGKLVNLGGGENDVAVNAVGSPLEVMSLVQQAGDQLLAQFVTMFSWK